MNFVTSKDGVKIAYSKSGTGPAVILVDGAMCSRAMGPMPAIAEAVGPGLTLYVYDRRQRGDSATTNPATLQSEIEDIAALVHEAGSKAALFGISSGAVLAARATQHIQGIQKLALFEAPMIVDKTMPPMPADFLPRIETYLAAGNRSAAVEMFMKYVGIPGFVVTIMSLLPFWKKVLVNAHTLPTDLRFIEPNQQQKPLMAEDWQGIDIPTLVMDGGKSPPYMRNAQRQWADTLPNARYQTLPGQTHNVKAEAIAPVLAAFFK